jgi:mxaL protein
MSALARTGFRLQACALLVLLSSFLFRPWHVARPIYELVAIMDITGSMNVRDQASGGAPATRLAAEKAALRAMLAALPCGSRLGLGIFVERRPLLLLEPIETCGNFGVLDAELGAIDWKMGWDSESHIAEGIANTLPLAGALGADMIFLTDGQEEPPLAWTAPPDFARVRGTAHGLVVGVGGYGFSPIPRFDRQGNEIGIWRRDDVPAEPIGIFHGHENMSAVDEPHLRDLARQSGLTYLHLTDPAGLFPAFAASVPPRLRASTIDLRFVAAALALLLLAGAASPSFLKKNTSFLIPRSPISPNSAVDRHPSPSAPRHDTPVIAPVSYIIAAPRTHRPRAASGNPPPDA